MTVATRTLALKAGTNAVTVPLSRTVRKKLGKARRVTLRVRVFTPFGTIFRATVTVKR